MQPVNNATGKRGSLRAASLLLLLLCCSCLAIFSAPFVCAAADAADIAPLQLHTSLVDLLNADQTQWTVLLGSAPVSESGEAAEDDTAVPVSWTEMREVRVDGQPMESAASLLFTLPPPTNSYYGVEDVEEEEAAQAEESRQVSGDHETVHSDDVFTRAQRRQLFGLPALSFHGLSCEEYGTAGRGPGARRLRGRCFFLRDSGEDFFFNYVVEVPRPVSEDSDAERPSSSSSPSSPSQRRRRRTRAGDDSAESSSSSGSAAAQESGKASAATPSPRQAAYTSQGGVWSEFIVLPGADAGEVGAEGDVRLGTLRVAENITQAADAARSTRVRLALTLTMTDAKATGKEDQVPAVPIRLVLEGVTGAFCAQAKQQATMELQAARTSLYNRYGFPLLYIAGLYGLVYGVAWWQAKRSAAAAAAAAPSKAGGAASGPASSVKKQQ